MPYWLAKAREGQATGFVKRFDPRFWTVNFPRPMMASVVTTAADALRVDLSFCGSGDLAGLIWDAEDRWDHPLLAYETDRDFRRCVLRFRWRSAGVKPLDAVHGPTLTVEGRDEAGQARVWHVRLWNYANGTPEDAEIELDFSDLTGGFLLPEEADPVWAGDVDRLFLSLVPAAYDAGDAAFPAAEEAWAELSGIACDGSGSVLSIGDVMVPPHGLSMTTGYDDAFNQTPARLARQVQALGYRGDVGHYVGMSHYPRLVREGGAWRAAAADGEAEGGAVAGPALAWHRGFATALKASGLGLILSLSYELFDAYCPEAWKQRDADGAPALTGWSPPSTLVSPANAEAMAWLQDVARAFVAVAVEAGLPPKFQIGEPWWWVFADGRICLYDAAARAALGGSPIVIADVRGDPGAAETALLDAAGAILAGSTAALTAAVKAQAPDTVTHLLAYLPTVLDAAAPEAKRANLPVGWAAPAFDVLQLEDYDWVTEGRSALTRRGVALATERLGYPAGQQDYYAGFVLAAEQAAGQWPRIAAAADAARARGTARTFVWALPQVARDGFTYFANDGEGEVQAFDDVIFPLDIGRQASVSPAFSTQVVESLSGHEQRSSDWADARLRFDAGPGVRSEADLMTLIAFFRARRGQARGFRFSDPYDFQSGEGAEPQPTDQALGVGDGVKAEFALCKYYGAEGDAQQRRITRPVPGSIRVAVDGVERLTGWAHLGGGVIAFDAAPAEGALLTAGFRFDVPVRFAEDRLDINRTTFAAGEAPSVPLVEIRE